MFRARYARYPGISGRTQGERNDIKPAVNAKTRGRFNIYMPPYKVLIVLTQKFIV